MMNAKRLHQSGDLIRSKQKRNYRSDSCSGF